MTATDHPGGVYPAVNRLAAAARKIREATEARDLLIREMHADGYALRGIAKHAELSHETVRKIING